MQAIGSRAHTVDALWGLRCFLVTAARATGTPGIEPRDSMELDPIIVLCPRLNQTDYGNILDTSEPDYSDSASFMINIVAQSRYAAAMAIMKIGPKLRIKLRNNVPIRRHHLPFCENVRCPHMSFIDP